MAEESARLVMVVDDDVDFAESLGELLAMRGFQVTTVSSADAALAQLADGRPDVALLDIRLGRSSGLDLLSAFRKRAPDTLCVMMTAYPETDTAIAALHEGAYDYLGKPMVPESLFHTLDRCFERIRLVREAQSARDDLKRRNEQLGAANEQLRLREERLQSTVAELAESNAELERFAHVASHDLQEPLRNVASYVQLLKRRYGGRLDSEADEFIDFAVQGARRMQALIRDLLEYSRAGMREVGFQPVDLGEVLGHVLADLHEVIDSRGAHIQACDLPTVLGDHVQLGRVLQNLLSNALKFQVPEATPRVELACEKSGSEWLLSVRDNGIGFEPDYAERVFAIYERLHASDRYEGTGIGLAVCRKIVERHSGRIWAESAPGEGACFRFTLPCMDGADA